ncbi:MAG: peptidase MA family metallohydrolase [Planctomycetaceae bacterium]
MRSTAVLAIGILLLATVPGAYAEQPVAAVSACACQHCRTSECSSRGDWSVAETAHFSVWSRDSRHFAANAAAHCEKVLAGLAVEWKIDDELVAWHPKCAVVVHVAQADYLRELGGSSEDQSVGCTTVTVDDGRVVFRRIDLRADAADWRENALPHELTHVLLAERFATAPIPEWLNEGLAMLSEAAELREQRQAVLAESLTRGTLPPLQDFLADRGVHRIDANVRYAVHRSLIAYLESLDGREKLLDFADLVATSGYASALRETYGFDGGAAEWERRWIASLRRDAATPVAIR